MEKKPKPPGILVSGRQEFFSFSEIPKKVTREIAF